MEVFYTDRGPEERDLQLFMGIGAVGLVRATVD